jgi:O-antigen/teichoic acid export membrane protein
VAKTRFEQKLVSAISSFAKGHWHKLKASPVGYRLAKGFGWSFVGAVLSRVLTLCSSVIVARLIGKVGVGQVGMVQSTVGMFTAFAGLGMGLTATKYVAEFRTTNPGRALSIIRLSAWVCWVTGLIMTLVVAMMAPVLARKTLGGPELSIELLLGSGLLLLGAVNGGQMGALGGFEAFKAIARINFFSGLVSLPTTVAAVYFWGVPGAVCALVFNQGVTCLLSHGALLEEKAKLGASHPRPLTRADFKLLWHFSLPGMLCNLIFAPANWTCNAFLVNRAGGYGELGIFNAANGWLNAVTFLPGLLGQVVLPVLSQASGEGNSVRSRKILVTATKVNALFVAPVVLAGCLASPFIMRLYGPGFQAGWSALALLFLTAGLVCIQGPVGQLMIATGRMWLTLAMYCLWSFSFVGLTWEWVGAGAIGMAAAKLVAQVINAFCVFAFALWLLRRSVHASGRSLNTPERHSNTDLLDTQETIVPS